MHSKGGGGRVQSAVDLKKQIETISHSPLVHQVTYRLLDSLVVECWLRVREVPGSIPSQGPRHTTDVIKWYQ